MAIKIDTKKAFDMLDWGFLIQVLKAFGFHPTFYSSIQSILLSTKLFLSVNGNSIGHPFCFFCIVEEVLSRGISALAKKGLLTPLASPKNFTTHSHVMLCTSCNF